MSGSGERAEGRADGAGRAGMLAALLRALRPARHRLQWPGARSDHVADVDADKSALRLKSQSWSGVEDEGRAPADPMEISGEVCRIQDSPFRILKVAASGNMREFERLYNADNSRLHLRDSKGQTVFHHAATKSRTNIMDFIIKHGGEINSQDKNGNTPLHIAVEKAQTKGVTYLLEHACKPDLQNTKGMAPIHAAVEFSQSKVIEALLGSGKIDVNLQDVEGSTPLHYAAMSDNGPCAEVLIHNSCDVMRKSAVGFVPTHIAAKGGAHKVLQLILSNAQKLGVTTESLLCLRDREKKSPLHSAVNSGSMEVVEVCLKYGAAIDSQQDDLSTPVHGAVSQGRLDMVRGMLEASPDAATRVLEMKDVMGMTPLHTAAVFDQALTAEYLLQKGADPDSQDREGRTPLLVAASRQAWPTVKLLLSNKADMAVRDNRSRNFLHLAIMNSAKLQDFGETLFNLFENTHISRNFLHLAIMNSAKLQDFGETLFNAFKALLNERDDFGCTPMHYASREGHLSAIEDLITLGAFLNIKNNEKHSPLHFAARYGRLNTCLRLLNSSEGPNLINENDGDGLTALHIAAQNGQVKVVECLLQKGAALHRDNAGNTPLHLAAAGYTQTMKVLLSVHMHILNARNAKGETAIHVAAKAGHTMAVTLLMSMNADFVLDNDGYHFLDYAILLGHKDVAIAIISHERWREAMGLRSQVNASPMIELVKHLPEVSLAVLDRCQTPSSTDEKDKDFYYHYDFQYLQSSTCFSEGKSEDNDESETPMYALNMMVQFNRVECLSHPVCVNFLRMKWRAYGFSINMANIGIYVIFLIVLTIYVTALDPSLHTHSYDVSNITTIHNTSKNFAFSDLSRRMPSFHKIGMPIVIGFCAVNMLKELVQMFQQKGKYFTDFNNALEWLLYTTTAMFIVPTTWGELDHRQWECGAVAVFMAWFNFLLYLQRFDFFGIYVVMFLEILKTLVRVITVFSILIIAFGLSFYMLLSKEETPAHRTPELSLMRTFIMMLGEIDYIPIFMDPQADGRERPLHYGGLPFIFLIVFVLLMPILLMNLLIGLAVGDIESVQRNARLKRLAMQVELHTDLERKLPRRILKLVDKTELKIYTGCSNNPCSWVLSWIFRTGETEPPGKGRPTTFCNEYSIIYDELQRQKKRLKDLSLSMEKQHELLRLVVQKMEIHSSLEQRDVGDVTNAGTVASRQVGWPLLKSVFPRQVAVLSSWKTKGIQPTEE